MRYLIYPSLLACALGLGTTGAMAQQTAPSPSRWLVGVAGLLEHRVFVVNNESSGNYLIGGKAYAAYSLSPSLTMKAGLLHGRGGSLDDNRADDGTPKYVSSSTKESVWGVPVELRCHFSQPERRFQVDGLLGVSIYATRQTTTNNILLGNISSEGWYPVLSQDKAVNGFWEVGMGFRYALSPTWQIVTDLSVNTNMKPTGYYGISLGAAASVGAQYRF